MRGPTPRFYFAPGHTWTTPDASVVWVEITAYVLSERGAGGSRGRGSELDDYRAGKFNLVLNNRDRRFDPSHAAGPYFGQLLPGVPFKVEAVANSTTFPVFRGFIDGWPQDYDLSNKLGIVNLSVTDGFGKLATAGTPSSAYAAEVAADSPVGWWRLRETAGQALADSSGNEYDGSYSIGSTSTTDRNLNPWEEGTSLSWVGANNALVGAAVTAGGDTTVELLVRFAEDDTMLANNPVLLHHRGPSLAQDWRLRVDLAGGFEFQLGTASLKGQDTARNWRDGLAHLVAIRNSGGTLTLWVDGAIAPTSTVLSLPLQTGLELVFHHSHSTSLTIDCVMSDVSAYDDDLADARIEAHYAAWSAPWDGDTVEERADRILDLCGWPADLRDLATGFTLLGPAVLGKKVLALLKGYEKAEQGRLFISRDGKVTFLDRYYHHTVTEGTTVQATFSDDGSDIAYSGAGFDYDDRVVYNRVRGSRPGGATVEVFDQTSIDTYGEQVDSDLEGIQVGTDAQVRGACEQRLDRYKDPQLRARPIELRLGGLTAARQATILGLELGYRVNLERTPQGVGSAIDQETIIEGISHRIRGGEWTTTLTFSPVDTHQYAIWGQTSWGDSAGWGY